jgi:hypothetical protein
MNMPITLQTAQLSRIGRLIKVKGDASRGFARLAPAVPVWVSQAQLVLPILQSCKLRNFPESGD